MRLEGLCEKWLKNNFKMGALIRKAVILDQEEIDKALNLVPIECSFTNDKGEDCYTVAFLDAGEVQQEDFKGYFWDSFHSFLTFFTRLNPVKSLGIGSE